MLEKVTSLLQRIRENPRVGAVAERLDGGGLHMKGALRRNLKAAGTDLDQVHIPTPAELQRATEAGRLEAFLAESGFTQDHGTFTLAASAGRDQSAAIRVTPKADGFAVAYRARVQPQGRFYEPSRLLMQDAFSSDGRLTTLPVRSY